MEDKVMKAKELIKILEEHPDAIVSLFNYNPLECTGFDSYKIGHAYKEYTKDGDFVKEIKLFADEDFPDDDYFDE